MEQISSAATNKQPNAYKITFRKILRAAFAEVRVHKKLAIITYVLYGVAMLLFLFNSHFYTYNYGFSVSFSPSGWGVAFAAAGVFVTFFAVLNIFRDTGNQQLCDVGMALPIKASERFLSKLLCLVFIQIAPFTVSLLAGNWIAVFIGSIIHGTPDDETAKWIFMMFFIGLAIILFITAITTLCACCCGALAESAYFTFIMMFIINVLPIAFLGNILNTSSGFDTGWHAFFDRDSLLIDISYWGIWSFFCDEDLVIPHSAVSCGISIIVTLLSGLIYKKRDARSVGTPISSKLFFEIMMAGACATMFSLTFMNSDLLWGVLIAGVAYIIINVIVSRAKINVLSFVKWIGKFALTTAVFTALVVACVKTGGFGYYRLRPDKVYLENVDFHITCAPTGSHYRDESIWIESKAPLTADQADEVMKICKKHLQKGVAGVNPFRVIFDVYYSPWIDVEVRGNVQFGPSRSPKFMFYERYNSDTRIIGYYLNYSQMLHVSYNELTALAEELKQLDYMYEKDHSTPDIVYYD